MTWITRLLILGYSNLSQPTTNYGSINLEGKIHKYACEALELWLPNSMFYMDFLLIGSYSILWEIPSHICHQSVRRLILPPYRFKLWNPQLLRYVYVKTGHTHSHIKREFHRTSFCVLSCSLREISQNLR